jgi:phage replication-related protein YjqB (UPF0714/DUF867 family)
MDDAFAQFSHLENHFTEGVHFRRVIYNREGKILILALHGGGIERGTSEVARAIAGDNLSLYLFEGLMRTAKESKVLHITSTHFDEPDCLNLIGKFQKALAIHGYNGKESMIYVGGRDNELKDILIAALNESGFPVRAAIRRYAGDRPTNICNRTGSGKGVQLELSKGLRRTLFEDWRTRKGRKTTTALFSKLVTLIRSVIEQ